MQICVSRKEAEAANDGQFQKENGRHDFEI